jgi:acyl-CoA synthetase (AMP-forming)/AMP-acid ligase II/acyl carrier protein
MRAPSCTSSAAPNETLVDVVRHWAVTQPTRPACTFLADGAEQTLDYAGLDRRARALAVRLVALGLRGRSALLAHPPDLSFVLAFFACLYAGVVAVPVPHMRGRKGRARLGVIARDARAAAVLSTASVAAGLRPDAAADALGALPWLDTEALASDAGDAEAPLGGAEGALYLELEARGPTSASTAFLQYTSGSTAAPKGTVISHGNILANQRMLASAFGTHRASVIVSWLPLFHDMGLIGNLLHGIFLGARVVLLPTLATIKNPIGWLRAIERYRGTFSGAPNFAYDLCVSATTSSERAGLDLGSWEVAFNGSEPVRWTTLERFRQTFAPCGLRPLALTPCYGLAEATLVVSASAARPALAFAADRARLERGRATPATRPSEAISIVGCGSHELGDQQLCIVDPASGRVCEPGEVGEIWVSGSHVAQGYFADEAASRETFGARLPDSPRRFLRTGDLGFLSDGELFVSGRIKDLLIVRGQKLHAIDLEASLEEALPELRRGGVAAFGVERAGEPGLVIAAAVERRDAAGAALASEVARQVRLAFELEPERVLLLARHRLPRTTSGKLQRQQCRQDFLAGRFASLAEWPAPARGGELGARAVACARAWLAERCGREPSELAGDEPLAAFGVDSIRKVELIRALEAELGVAVSDDAFHAADTIDALGVAVARLAGPAPAGGGLAAPGEAAVAAVPEPATAGRRAALVLPGFKPLDFGAVDPGEPDRSERR